MLFRTFATVMNCLLKSRHSFVLPYNLVIENTTYCNLRCQHCWRTNVVKQPRHMPFDLFKRIIDEVRPKKVNIIGNGEPFMHPQIFDFLKYAKQKGCIVYTNSNGLLIDKQAARLLVELGVDSVGISIDAATQETYAKIRGGQLEKVFSALEYLSEEKSKAGLGHPSIGVAFLIQRDNFSEMQDFAKKIDGYPGVDFISFQRLKFLSPELKAQKDLAGEVTYEDLIKRIGAIKKGSQVKIFYDEHLADKMWKKNILSQENYFTGKCIQPWYSAYVTVAGDVLPCCFFSATSNLSLGDLNRASFKEIWNNSNFRRFRRELKRAKAPHEICAECYPFGLGDYFKIEKRFIKMLFNQITGKKQ
jgi:radical SAM protein with 4Fe4S-binding SPASM domain